MPEISVVMTSYNHERYLSEAIESVLGQTYKDIELIIVDDASIDKSKNIILKYADKDERVRYVFHDKNFGIARTTNDGFDEAKGNFIAYMQSDDVWFLHKLETQIQVLKQNPDLIVWSDAVIIDSNGNNTGQLMTERARAQNKKKSGFIFTEYLTSGYIYVQSTIFKREYARRIRFDTKLRYTNDYKFILELSVGHEFFFIPEPLLKYRIHGDNTSFKNRDVWIRDSFRLQKEILQKYKDRIPERLKAKFYYKIGRFLFNIGHRRFSRNYLFQAIKKDFIKIKYCKALMKSYYAKEL